MVSRKGGAEETVIIVGYSNTNRCREAAREKVKRDARVQVGAFPGQTVRTVTEKAKDKLWQNKKGRNLVVTAGGLNDALKGSGAEIGKQVDRGVKDLWAMCHSAQIAVCTVPEIRSKGVQVEWGSDSR